MCLPVDKKSFLPKKARPERLPTHRLPKLLSLVCAVVLIKDHEERTVPISENAAGILIGSQEKCPPGYPYVFIPQSRYDFIQTERRAKGDWTYSDSRLDIYNNFYKQFDGIFIRAGIKKKGKFYDCRYTALSNWFAQGVSKYEVMKLAGHSSFETTHRFYLAIKNDYLDKARQANVGLGLKLVEWE